MDIFGIVNDYNSALKKYYKLKKTKETAEDKRTKIETAFVLVDFFMFFILSLAPFITLIVYLNLKINTTTLIAFEAVVWPTLFIIIFTANFGDLKKFFKKVSTDGINFEKYIERLKILYDVLKNNGVVIDSMDKINILIAEVTHTRDKKKGYQEILKVVFSMILFLVSGVGGYALQNVLPYFKSEPVLYKKFIMLILLICAALIFLAVMVLLFIKEVISFINMKYDRVISCLRQLQFADKDELADYISKMESIEDKGEILKIVTSIT